MPIIIPPPHVEREFTSPVTRHTRRVEIYESDGITRWAGDPGIRLKGGSISVDYDRDERRSLDLVLDNSDGSLVNAPGQFWYDKILKVYRGVMLWDQETAPRVLIVTSNRGSVLAQELRRAMVELGFGRAFVRDGVTRIDHLVGYDLVINLATDRPAINDLMIQAYEDGISILTFGNGTFETWGEYLFGPEASDDDMFFGTATSGEHTVVPEATLRHPLTEGWSDFSYDFWNLRNYALNPSVEGLQGGNTGFLPLAGNDISRSNAVSANGEYSLRVEKAEYESADTFKLARIPLGHMEKYGEEVAVSADLIAPGINVPSGLTATVSIASEEAPNDLRNRIVDPSFEESVAALTVFGGSVTRTSTPAGVRSGEWGALIDSPPGGASVSYIMRDAGPGDWVACATPFRAVSGPVRIRGRIIPRTVTNGWTSAGPLGPVETVTSDDWTVIYYVYQMPTDMDNLQIRPHFVDVDSAEQVYTDDWVAVVADTQEAALAGVQQHFEGKVDEYENYLLNPRGRGISGELTIAENLVNNPRGRRSISEVIIQENLIPNPSFENDLSQVLSSGTATINRATAFATPHGNAYMAWRVEEGATASSGWVRQDIDIGYSVHDQWVGFSVLARRSGSGIRAFRMFYQARQGGINQSSSYMDGFDLTEARMVEQTRHVSAAFIPAGTDSISLWLRPSATPAGGTPEPGLIHTDAWMAVLAPTEEGARQAVSRYWDGDSISEDSDFTISWSGDAHQSSSLMTAPRVAGSNASTAGVSYYSASRDAIAFRADGSGGVATVTSTVASRDLIRSGVTEVIEMKVNAPRDLTVYWDIQQRRWARENSGPVTLGTMEQPSTHNGLRQFAVNSPDPGETFYFRSLATEGAYFGDYFDGETSVDEDFTSSWTGDAHGSSSVITAPRPTGWNQALGVTYYSRSRDSLATIYVDTSWNTLTSTPVSIPDTGPYTVMTDVLYVTAPVQFRLQHTNSGDTQPVNSLGAEESGTFYMTADATGSTLWVRPIRNFGTGNLGATIYFRTALVRGEYSGEFFDGSTVGASWDGEPNNSASRIPAGIQSIETSIQGIDSDWRRVGAVFNLPEGFVPSYADISIHRRDRSWTAGEVAYLDAFLVERSSEINEYYDGDMPGAHWSGTQYFSVSPQGFTTKVLLEEGVTSDNLEIVATDEDEGTAILSAIESETARWAMYHYPMTFQLLHKEQFKGMLRAMLNWANPVEPDTHWEVQVGEFMIDRITEPDFPHEMSITGRDYAKKAMNSKFVHPTQFSSERSETLRTNFITNPSFELGTEGWSTSGNLNIVTTALNRPSKVGELMLNMQTTNTSGTPFAYYDEDLTPGDVGLWIGFSVLMGRSNGAFYGTIAIQFRAGTSQVGNILQAGEIELLGGDLERISLAHEIPTGAEYVRLLVYPNSRNNSHNVVGNNIADAAMGVKASSEEEALQSVDNYFDGDSEGQDLIVHEWASEEHNSPSVERESSVPTLEETIEAIAGAGGIVRRILPETEMTIGRDFFFDRGASRWEAMKEIATAYNYELYFNASGFLVMRPFRDPTTAPPFMRISTGKNGQVAEYQKSTSDARIYNHVIVAGESSDADIESVWAERTNDDPRSPTAIRHIGARLHEYTSSFLQHQEQADDLADSLLTIGAMEEYELSFETLMLPWLEVGDILGWDDPNPAPGAPDTFLLTTITIPLTLGPMSINAKRVNLITTELEE